MLQMIDWTQLLRGVWKRAWLILLLVAAVTTALGILGTIKYGQVQYEARASILYRTKQQKKAPFSSGSQLTIRELARNTAVSLLRRPANLETAITNLSLTMRASELGWRVATQSEKQSEIIIMRVEYMPTADLAVRAVNEITRIAVEDNRAFYQNQARQFAEQSEEQATLAARAVTLTREQLTAFQVKHQMLEVGADTKAFLDSMIMMNERLNQAKIAYDAQLVRIENYRQLLAKMPEEVVSQSLEDNPIKRRIANMEVALMEARTKYGSDNPRVLLMEDNLKEMRKTMTSKSYDESRERVYIANPVKREFETELLRLEAEKEVLAQSVKKVENQLTQVTQRYGDLPQLQLELAGYLQRHASAVAQCQGLQNAANDARLAMTVDMSDFEILEPARTATANRSKIAILLPILGFIVMLISGIFLCLLIELLDTRIKTVRQLEQAFTIPCLASIPALNKENLAESLLPICRSLYQRITLQSPSERIISITLLSAVAGEGKSTLGYLLARYWSALGIPTAYLDFDACPNPHLHPPATLIGIDDYLAEQASWEHISFHQEGITCFKRLENTGDLPERLHGPAMRRMIDTLTAHYRCIIIDTPSCEHDDSAPLLARLTTYSLFLVNAANTSRNAIDKAMDRIERMGVRPLGTVLNFLTAKTTRTQKGDSR